MNTKIIYKSVNYRRLRGEIQTVNFCPKPVYFVFRQICNDRDISRQNALAQATEEWVNAKLKEPNSEIKTPGYSPRQPFDKSAHIQFSFWLPRAIHVQFKAICVLNSLKHREGFIQAITMWSQSRLGTENQRNLSEPSSSCTKLETEITEKLEDKSTISAKAPKVKELAAK